MIKPVLALLATASVAASVARADVTLINVFEVPEGQRAAAVTAWEAARDFLAAQPGYVDTTLYEAMGPVRFQLINVAHWESPAHFTRAIAAMRAAGISPGVEGLGINPALYQPLIAD